jgi:nitroimidazol reductase NimA-like FMN-containing flavoprotein (pyridoxamine 5'-phosphate oxidase superfamily)
VATHPSDLARRAAHRRKELGKSIEEVAAKAGIDPGYLRYFEANATARLSGGSLILLAMALETTPGELTGGNLERPPGRGGPGPSPELRELTPEQCQAHLEVGGVGRVVYVSERGPVAHPVNFASTGGDVVISTTGAAAERLEDQGRVSFQIDRVDEAMSEGWSVLVTGRARWVDDPDELVEVAALELEPWAGGPRHTIIRITPDVVTGRVIIQHSSKG